jgi:hypothetical protein
MLEFVTGIQKEFGTAATYFAVAIFLSTIPFCLYKKRWLDVGPVVMLLLTSAGVASGFKITMLTMFLPLNQLGALGDDKPALIVGGLATLVLSLREVVNNWRKVTDI